jgi:hypothetical protein
MIYYSRYQRGFAVLEAAAVSVLLTLAVIFGIGLSGYLASSTRLTSVLNRALTQHTAAPFILDQSTQIGSGVVPLILNTTELSTLIDTIALELERDLISNDAINSYQVVDPSRYFIEVGYAVVNVNPNDGSFISFVNNSAPFFSLSRTRGALAAQAGEAELAQSLQFAVSQGLHAFPLGSFGAGSLAQFFNQSVLVGARVIFKPEGQAIDYIIRQSLGHSGRFAQAKVVALRGQME